MRGLLAYSTELSIQDPVTAVYCSSPALVRGLLAYSLDEDFNIGGAFANLCYPQVLSNLNRIIASNPNFYDFTCPEDRPTMISPIGEVVNNDSGQPGWSGAPPLCVNMDGCNKDDLNDYLDVVTLNLVG